MASHPSPPQCGICRSLAECAAGTHRGALLELPSGWAVLGDTQFFSGYCLLMSRLPATELHELNDAARRLLMDDVALLARTVWNVTRPHKLNYECLGNAEPHLHWHIFPRLQSEAEPLKPVWLSAPQGPDAAPFALNDSHEPLRDALRAELGRLLHERGNGIAAEGGNAATEGGAS